MVANPEFERLEQYSGSPEVPLPTDPVGYNQPVAGWAVTGR